MSFSSSSSQSHQSAAKGTPKSAVEEAIEKSGGVRRCSDGVALVPITKLKVVMRNLGLEPRAQEVQQLARRMRENDAARAQNPDDFDASELAALLAERLQPDEKQTDELHCVFKLFDADAKGFITAQDLRRVADELGEEQLDDEELIEMIATASKGGKVNEGDFRAIMKKINLY